MPDEPIATSTPSSPTPVVDTPSPVATPPEPVAPASSTPPTVTPEPAMTSPLTPPPIPSSERRGLETTPPPVTPSAPSNDGVRSLLSKALAKIQFRKRAKLEKVMVLAKARGQITNDDAQKLLRVSDATASRYLAELVKMGRLRRSGSPSHSIYQPIQ